MCERVVGQSTEAPLANFGDRRSVKKPFVDRADCVLDTGAYMLNLSGCAKCGERKVKEEKRNIEVDDGDSVYEETITFHHVFCKCSYVVAVHNYSFSVEGYVQCYEMSCMLCGTGKDERRIQMSSSDNEDDSDIPDIVLPATQAKQKFFTSTGMLSRAIQKRHALHKEKNDDEEEDDEWN